MQMHEDIKKGLRREPYETFIRKYAMDVGSGTLPLVEDAKGAIIPYINHGRWLVECPNCHSAVQTSRDFDYYICPECGSPENDSQWYNVGYPIERAELEAALLKRPLISQNWNYLETVADLKKENADNGLDSA